MNNSYLLGLEGESLALSHLEKKGYKIIKTRCKTKHGEIDIIARKDNLLCFVEVKYRPKARLGEALTLVDKKKLNHIRLAIGEYFSQNKPEKYRIDLVEITRAGIWHIENLN